MTYKTKPKKDMRRQPPPGWQDPLRQQNPLISGRWLLRAVGITVAIAFVCGYLTLCLLFYQGRWQLIFHPSSQAVTSNPSSTYEAVAFDATETGQPQLSGWWVPAKDGAQYADSTVLYLHGASGSLSETVPGIERLNRLGINVFAIDYRGFGHSMALHPSEQSVYEDADAAITYLTVTRKLNIRNIVLYGSGLGATVAAEMAARHPEIPALILEDPVAPALDQIAGDRRTSLIPVRLLVADRFDLGAKLQTLKTPKLLLELGTGSEKGRSKRLFDEAAPPKMMADISASGTESAAYDETLRRFLDERKK